MFAHLSDMKADAENGILRTSAFFTLAEQRRVRTWLGSHSGALIWGGYENAERARVYFLPDFIDAQVLDEGMSVGRMLTEYGYDDPTAILKITASGFRELSHRDYMGSVLSLGIERDVIGDIVVADKYSAYLFCDSAILPFILDNLKKVANDAVKITPVESVPSNFGQREYKVIKDTVASGRFDAIVACVCSLSRENAKKLVSSGMCELNFEVESAPDAELDAGDIFSIRGYGRYKLQSYDGENRRGRCRITVYKYV